MKQQKRIEINAETPIQKIAVYGTLREGWGNGERLLKGQGKFLGIHNTEPNYTMYTTGGFPIVSPKGNTSIEIEVYEIADNDVLRRIHALEGCTGIVGDPQNWYDLMPIETPFGEAYMYVQPNYKSNRVIESGNWNKQ